MRTKRQLRFTVRGPGRAGSAATASTPRVAEFFAGVGLVRLGLEGAGCRVVYANDLDAVKAGMYAANFRDSHMAVSDVRCVRGRDVPEVEVATASFPCTDLSLAGNRAGLNGERSGVFWEFTRVLDEMRGRLPGVVLVENVVGLATSHDGRDLAAVVSALNGLGYVCDVLKVDARHFVPQSRPRLFIIGSLTRVAPEQDIPVSQVRPAWVASFARRHRGLELQSASLPELPETDVALADLVDDVPEGADLWWDDRRVRAFVRSLSALQGERLERLRDARRVSCAAAYRRTREGKPVWEVRPDSIAGCLRTTRGGSSKQALVQAGRGRVRIRWMTGREYARLQGAPEFAFAGATESQVRFALGDAVCVPVVKWLAEHYVLPLVRGTLMEVVRECAV